MSHTLIPHPTRSPPTALRVDRAIRTCSLPSSSGGGTYSSTSKRPGRMRAASTAWGLLVAPSTSTPACGRAVVGCAASWGCGSLCADVPFFAVGHRAPWVVGRCAQRQHACTRAVGHGSARGREGGGQLPSALKSSSLRAGPCACLALNSLPVRVLLTTHAHTPLGTKRHARAHAQPPAPPPHTHARRHPHPTHSRTCGQLHAIHLRQQRGQQPHAGIATAAAARAPLAPLCCVC